jgi:hypothetical protein
VGSWLSEGCETDVSDAHDMGKDDSDTEATVGISAVMFVVVYIAC